MNRGLFRSIVFVLAAGTALGARAAALPGVTLPTLALDPAPQPSVWTGLSVGTEVFVLARKGSKGLVGGAFDVGYDREFANRIVLGIQGSAGFAPAWSGAGRFKGFDFAATDVKVGYDLGRVMPFVTAGVVLEKPHLGPGAGLLGAESVNALMNGPGTLRAATRLGVGVDYAITNNLTLGLAVSAVNGRGPLVP